MTLSSPKCPFSSIAVGNQSGYSLTSFVNSHCSVLHLRSEINVLKVPQDSVQLSKQPFHSQIQRLWMDKI